MKDKVLEILKEAVSDLNEELQYESLENPDEDTILFGGDEGIDSLSLVRLVIDVEQRLKEELNLVASLADEKAMSARRTPYRTVGTLADFALEQSRAA
jgi:D-alanine--poly(phosphoribitol) ligase subunit 2